MKHLRYWMCVFIDQLSNRYSGLFPLPTAAPKASDFQRWRVATNSGLSGRLDMTWMKKIMLRRVVTGSFISRIFPRRKDKTMQKEMLSVLTQIMHFNIILIMNAGYTPISMIKSLRDLINRPFGQILQLQNLGKQMKRVVWVNPASFIKFRGDLISGPFRRENVKAFSLLMLIAIYFFSGCATTRSPVLEKSLEEYISEGNAAMVAGDFHQAGKVYDEAIAIADKQLKDDPAARALIYNLMASVHSQKGDLRSALFYHYVSLSMLENELGENHPDYVRVLLTRVETYAHFSLLDEANLDYERAFNIMKAAGQENDRLLIRAKELLMK